MSSLATDTLDAIDVCLLNDELRKTLRKHDSSQPDSLGDRLFCMSLKISYQFRAGSIPAVLIEEAKSLLIEASPQYARHYAGRWRGGYAGDRGAL